MIAPKLARCAAHLALLFATASLGAAQAQSSARHADPRGPAYRSNEAVTRRLLDEHAAERAQAMAVLEAQGRREDVEQLARLVREGSQPVPGLPDTTDETRRRLRESFAANQAIQLASYGFTPQRVRALKARGVDVVQAVTALGPSRSLLGAAALAESVAVGEWVDADLGANHGDGARSTVRFRIVETLKGPARAGQVVRVRFYSGREADGTYSGVSTEPELMGPPGAAQPRGRRYLLLLSPPLAAYQAAKAGAKLPANSERYARNLAELIPIENGVLGMTHGYGGRQTLEQARAELRPMAAAAAQVAEIEAQLERGGVDSDAAMYALDHPISLAEAKRRLALQGRPDIGRLNVILPQKEAATFAGLWVQHEPEHRVVVAFTRDPRATLRKYTTDPLFEPRLAGVSQAELYAAQARALRELQALGVPADAATDIRSGRVDLTVMGDMARVRSAVASGRMKLPDYVVLKEPPPLAYAAPVNPPGGSSPVKSFPRYSHRSMGWPAAAISGELVLVDGCLRIKGPEGPLIVWGAENELDLTEPGVVRVFNRMTGKSVRVGERVWGGGGGFDPRPAPPQIDAPIDPACKGPYFAGTGFISEVEFDAERLAREARDLARQERISYPEAVRRIEARWARAKAKAQAR